MKIDIFKEDLDRTTKNYMKVYTERRGTISTAHQAFGGNISKGLLKRGQNALNAVMHHNTKRGRAECFYKMATLPTPFTNGYWQAIDELLTSLHLWADPVDSEDHFYMDAFRSQYCKPKIDSILRFIERYGNSKHKKLLILFNGILKNDTQ